MGLRPRREDVVELDLVPALGEVRLLLRRERASGRRRLSERATSRVRVELTPQRHLELVEVRRARRRRSSAPIRSSIGAFPRKRTISSPQRTTRKTIPRQFHALVYEHYTPAHLSTRASRASLVT